MIITIVGSLRHHISRNKVKGGRQRISREWFQRIERLRILHKGHCKRLGGEVEEAIAKAKRLRVDWLERTERKTESGYKPDNSLADNRRLQRCKHFREESKACGSVRDMDISSHVS